MNNDIVKTLTSLNSDYIPRFLANSHEHENVVEPSSDIPGLDKNNVTKLGMDYYDLMIANILLKRHHDVKCDLSSNIAEIITRMAYEGIRHMNIMDEVSAYKLCNDIALHKIPRRSLMYQYLNFILRYEHTVLPYWFYYTLLLWAFVDTKQYAHTMYRSRIFVGIIHGCCLTKFSDYKADRNHDVFDVKEKLLRVISACANDKRFENDYDGYISYMVDSLRIFSTIILSILMSRSCEWKTFTLLGNEVMTQQLLEHQKVIDVSYKSLTNKGEKR